MKRLTLLLIIILFSSNILHAGNFNWTKIVVDEDGTTAWYIDKKSIRKVGSYKFYWQLANYIKDYDEVFAIENEIFAKARKSEEHKSFVKKFMNVQELRKRRRK